MRIVENIHVIRENDLLDLAVITVYEAFHRVAKIIPEKSHTVRALKYVFYC